MHYEGGLLVKENQVTSCHSPDAGPGIHASHTSTGTGGV